MPVIKKYQTFNAIIKYLKNRYNIKLKLKKPINELNDYCFIIILINQFISNNKLSYNHIFTKEYFLLFIQSIKYLYSHKLNKFIKKELLVMNSLIKSKR
jgi:hypothetical protein